MAYNYEYPYTDPNRYNDDWLINKVKELATDWLKTSGEWTETQKAWGELKQYIADYFSNLDVQEEINEKLDAMEADGSLFNIIKPLFTDYQQSIDVLSARMDTFTALGEGATTGDAELADLRVDYTGKVWNNAGDAVRGVTRAQADEIETIQEGLDELFGAYIITSNNLFNKNDIIDGKYVALDGAIRDAENNWISKKIPIEANTVYYIWGNAGIYDANDNVVGYHSISDAGLYTMPANASYIICTGNVSVLNQYYLNKYASQGYDDFKAVSYAYAKQHGLTVRKSGTGDYTSLTKALWDNIGKGFTFYVEPGVYDLLEEYPRYFGSDIFNSSKFDNEGNPIAHAAWYEGLPIKDSYIYMSPNAIVTFNYDGSVQGLVDWFSPFKYIAPGGELHGGQIVCSNCRYAIHDDCYGSANDRRITDGVNIYYRSSRNVAIGGGLGKSSYVEFKNCYVDSGSVGYGIWYHNATLADAQSFVSIHDNYATASIEIQTLGPSTLVSKALVSNNKCHSVDKIANSEIDNFELVEWNNVTE